MAHISTAWLYSCMFTVAVLIPVTLSQTSTQRDINNIADNLIVKVVVETNHLSTATYDIAYRFTNAGNGKILHTDDWEIIFSLHNRNILTKRSFTSRGLTIAPYKDNLYKMTSNPKVWQGLNKGRMAEIIISAKGLSVFRQDTYPRFVVRSPNTVPMTIKSTDDDALGFVELAKVKNDNYSKMSAVQRAVMIPDVIDMDRVPATIVIPPPLNITISPEVPLLELSTITKFHVFHDATVSDVFKKYFEDTFSTIPNMSPAKLQNVTSAPQGNEDRIYIQQTKPDPSKSADYYELAVRPKTRQQNFNLIHMSATSEAGLHNAVESLMAAAGLYDVLPDMTIIDDARFQHRALSLDLTKNFFPSKTIKKVLKLMSTYKLNKLELNLGGDYGWRLEVKDMPELTKYASQRCLTKNEKDCLPPYLGAGAESRPTASGYFSLAEFSAIISYAYSLHIEVIPRFNILGGLLSAKLASKLRYKYLINTDPVRAKQMYLISRLPTITKSMLPEDEMSIEGLLDPCKKETFTFINTVIRQVNKAYSDAGVPFKAFHAGGGSLTKFLGDFPSCRKAKVTSTANALEVVIGAMQTTLSSVNAVLHVNEEAIVDPSTNDCLNIARNSQMTKNGLVAHFYKTFPGSPEEWDLDQDQLAYMDGAVVAPPSPENPNGTYDALLPYNGTKKGLTSWILPYRCANKGYKIVLKPENFFDLSQAYELDFDEPGNRKMRQFHIINMHRMMMYEPFNHYMNMDLGKDGYTFYQYRMCKLYPCEALTKPENVLGLAATLDTSVIRSEEMLWKMMLPRLLLFAEKAWRVGEHENILKAEDPNTLVVEENLAHRAGAITMEIENLMNNIAFKEGGRLDEAGYAYRVPTLGASIQLGVAFFRKPPYPLMVKSDIPRLEVEYRDLTIQNSKWQPLFNVDRNTGRITGGYMFDFPVSSQKIEVRATSAGGRVGGKRPGRGTIVEGKPEYYLPRDIPIDLREGACLAIADAWLTNIDNVTDIQWRRIIQNIGRVLAERRNFMGERQRALEQTVTDFNQISRSNVVLPMVFQEIQQAMDMGQNITALPASNIFRQVFQKDQDIHERRRIFMENRYGNWQQEYLKCKEGRAQATLLPETPSVETGFPGQGVGGGQTGVALPMGGATGRQAGGIGNAARAQSGRSQGVGQERGLRGGASVGNQRRGQRRGVGTRGVIAGR